MTNAQPRDPDLDAQPAPTVIGALPRSRPHRRSDKRDARPDAPGADPAPPASEQTPPGHHGLPAAELLGTAVRAAAELAEIGLSAGARALRDFVAHLPRP